MIAETKPTIMDAKVAINSCGYGRWFSYFATSKLICTPSLRIISLKSDTGLPSTVALTNTPSNGYLGITSSTGSLIISLSADFTQADVHDNQTYPAITFSLPQGVRSMAADSGYDDHKLYDFRGFKLVCPVSEIYNHTSSDSFRGLVWQLHEFRITRINQSLRLKYLVVSTLEVNGSVLSRSKFSLANSRLKPSEHLILVLNLFDYSSTSVTV